MENVLYRAALLGNISFLNDARNNELESGGIDEYFLRQTSHKNNILHLAIPRQQFEFIEVVLKDLISKQAIDGLIKQTNEDGNTPIHVAAEVGNMDMFKLLYDFVHRQMVVQEERSVVVIMTKNEKGNTPLHVALIHGKYEVAKLLIENHPNMVSINNNFEETPLHVATTHQPIFYGDVPIEKRKATSSAYLDTIKLLLEKESCIACSRDKTGATPLHRAASITSAYNLQIITLILDHCRKSAELPDASSKTILHLLKTIPSYKEGKDLLDFPEIFGLMNHQDLEGNTPLHTAAMNMNLNMVRALLDSSANQSVRNNVGLSAASLIQQQFEQTVEKNQMTVEICEAIDRANVSFLREKMHNFGNNFLLSRDSKRRNVLHKLMHINNGTPVILDDFVDFIEEVLESFPTFVCQIDLNGDTPLHILMRNSPDTLIRFASASDDYKVSSLSDSHLVLKLLKLCCTYFCRDKDEGSSKGAHYDRPWLVQNSEGNTPLHEALINNQAEPVVEILLELDIKTTARLTNNHKETPLHLVAGLFNFANLNPDSGGIDNLANASEEAMYAYDKDGLTPLLRAAQSGNLVTISKLLNYFPDSAKMPDEKYGQTIWHLLVKHSAYSTWHLLRTRSKSDYKEYLIFKNFEGNTPLHLAIEARRFDHAIHFLEGMEIKLVTKLLEIKNDAGVTPSDLISSSQDIHEELERILNEDHRFIGCRSVYGIATNDINEYVNTIGVIAALLMTITFTAAFTVPGGAIQDTNKNDKGSPILVNGAAFQVFMVFDILTMSLSTMVLFCLLWILAAGSKRNSLMLLDTSIILLLISFYTTLLTFMAGVYATTIYVKPWIAIYTMVVCSSLMVLMQKVLIVKYLGYIGPILAFYTKKVINIILKYLIIPLLQYSIIRLLQLCKKKDESQE